MDYDIDEMERIIADNLATHFVKNYSINKSDIDTHYALGEIIYNEKINTAEKIKERASELSSRIGTKVTEDELNLCLKFYTYINQGMIKSYRINWNVYIELMKLNDIKVINKRITCD